MKRRTIIRILRRFVEVKPEEATITILLFSYFSLMMAAAYLILPLKTSLFLKQLKPAWLPLAYIVTAFLMIFVAAFNSRLLQALNRKKYISASLVFFIITLFAFWGLFRTQEKWVVMVFWFWAEVFLAITVIQFWILVTDLYTPRQAKRFIGFFVSGGLLGGVIGSLAVSLFSKAIGTENLVLACPALLVVGLAIIRASPQGPAETAGEKPKLAKDKAQARVGYLQSMKTLLQSRYLLLLSGMMLMGFAVSKLIDFQFNTQVFSHFPETNQRSAFLGTFFTILLLGSYLLHILLTNRVLKNYGLRVALLICPVVLAVGALAGFFVPAAGLIVWASLLRGADKSLAHSLNQSTREVMYIPVPVETKVKAKVFIDLFVNKFADALAALVIFLFFNLLRFSAVQMSFLTLAFILVWIIFNFRIIREYIGIVKKNLTIKWPDADKHVLDYIDVDTTKLIFDTLESRQRSSVLYAMNMMDLVRKDKLTPELKAIIGAKSSEVRAGSFDALLEVSGQPLAPEWEDAIEDQDMSTQVEEILSLDVYQELMRGLIDKEAKKQDKDSVVSQMEIAKALGMMKAGTPLVQNLSRLLKHESSEVVCYALESAGRQKRREFVPLIVSHLSHPGTEEAAVAALLDYGDRIAGMLKDYLFDPKEESKVRRNIPMILSRMGTQRTADLLLVGLKARDAQIQNDIIEALFKLRSRNPAIHFPEKDIHEEVLVLVKKTCALVQELYRAEKEGAKTHLAGDMEVLLARTLKQIFDLLSLVYPHEDVFRAYQNYHEGTKKSVDYSLELLENILKKDIKEIFLPILEERPLDEKAQICRKILKNIEN